MDPTLTSCPLFITLPVRDVAASAAFFERLGFGLDPRFAGDGGSAAVVLSEHATVMLAEHAKWNELSKLPAADPTTHAIALYCFAVATREQVDAVADAAIDAGGRDHDDAEDEGFMYSRSFFDLDGHGWQVMWMDPAAMA